MINLFDAPDVGGIEFDIFIDKIDVVGFEKRLGTLAVGTPVGPVHEDGWHRRWRMDQEEKRGELLLARQR